MTLPSGIARVVIESSGSDYYELDHIQVGRSVRRLGDLNCDGSFDGADIDPFFACLGGGTCP